jgi:hypothetical protein
VQSTPLTLARHVEKGLGELANAFDLSMLAGLLQLEPLAISQPFRRTHD